MNRSRTASRRARRLGGLDRIRGAIGSNKPIASATSTSNRVMTPPLTTAATQSTGRVWAAAGAAGGEEQPPPSGGAKMFCRMSEHVPDGDEDQRPALVGRAR